jgi:tetratricopeptide (TPR) repeat protein
VTYNNRAAVEYSIEDYEGALADYTRAIELEPDDAGAHYYRGLTFLMLGKKDDARACFKKAIALGYRVPPGALNRCQ